MIKRILLAAALALGAVGLAYALGPGSGGGSSSGGTVTMGGDVSGLSNAAVINSVSGASATGIPISNSVVISNGPSNNGSDDLIIGDPLNLGANIILDATATSPPAGTHFPHGVIQSASTDATPADGGNLTFQICGVDASHCTSIQCFSSDATSQAKTCLITTAGGNAIFSTNTGGQVRTATIANVAGNGAPNFPSNLTLGAASGTTGSESFIGTTSGTTVLTVPAAAGSVTLTLPTVATTGPTAQPSLSGQALVATTAGVQSYATVSLLGGGTNKTTGATSFWSGTAPSIAAATTNFVAFGENAGATAISTEANGQNLISEACTISHLSVKIGTAANTNVPVITVDKNTTGQTLTCSVANTATTCTDSTHSFATAAGDLLSVKVANPASANATGVVYIGFDINC